MSASEVCALRDLQVLQGPDWPQRHSDLSLAISVNSKLSESESDSRTLGRHSLKFDWFLMIFVILWYSSLISKALLKFGSL